MRYHFACDCHNHSHCSPDGSDSVLAMRSRAQELNAQAGRLVTEGTALADRIYGEVLKGLAN